MSFYANPPDGPYEPIPVSPPPKKSNNTLWIVLGSVAAVVVLACCGFGSLMFLADDGDRTSAGSDSSDDVDKGEEKQAAAAKVGDTVADGDFEFTVNKVEDGVKEVGDQYLGKKASGQFIIVHVTVKNIGDSADLFSDTEQKLVDTDGKEYDADSEAGIYIEDNQALLENINPGNKIEAQIVFDVPDGTELDSVLLVGSIGSSGVAVTL